MPSDYPKISIVTPSFNQADFLEDTIRSVLSQGYPNLEYVIIDGGSTDGSVEIIRKYADQLAYWVSEPDAGQYDAINKGFRHTSGEIMAYLNSDDKYTQWAFDTVGDIFRTLPNVSWVSTLTPLVWNKHGQPIRCERLRGFNRNSFLRGENLPRGRWYVSGVIQQESTFWRRSLWERTGSGFDMSLRLAGDFDLWARFYQHADLYGLPIPLGGFRRHGNQKTSQDMDRYFEEALAVLARSGSKPRGKWASSVREGLLRIISPELSRRFGLIAPSKQIRFDPVTQQWATETI